MNHLSPDTLCCGFAEASSSSSTTEATTLEATPAAVAAGGEEEEARNMVAKWSNKERRAILLALMDQVDAD